MHYCFRAGLYKQGLLHDLSKYAPVEFLVGCRYYQGDRSPNNAEREATGVSTAWLHHKGRNKHHPEYWVDDIAPDKTPIIPYKYAAEMICDKMAAGMAYEKEKFSEQYELDYWNKEKQYEKINSRTEQFVTAILEQAVEEGINKTFTKANFRKNYEKYCK